MLRQVVESSSLEEYAARHKQFRSDLAAGLPTSENVLVYSVNRVLRERPTNKRRYVGGFADRMKGLISCYVFARLLDRMFFIDWDYPDYLASTLEPCSFDWRMENAQLNDLDRRYFDFTDQQREEAKQIVSDDIDSVRETFKQDRMLFCFGNNYLYYEFMRHTELIRTAFSYSEKENITNVNIFQKSFSDLFRLNRKCPAMRRLDEFHDWKSRLDLEFVVGVQFRTGGDGKWKDPSIDSLKNCAAVEEAVRLTVSQFPLGKTGIFVTSDSEAARRDLNARLSGDFPVKTFDVEIAHLDRSPAEEAKSAQAQVIIENTVLSECDKVVTGRGGFGVIAAMRSGKLPVRYYDVVKQAGDPNS